MAVIGQMSESSSQTISCFELSKTAVLSFNFKLIMSGREMFTFNLGVFELWVCLNIGSVF